MESFVLGAGPVRDSWGRRVSDFRGSNIAIIVVRVKETAGIGELAHPCLPQTVCVLLTLADDRSF